MLSTNMARGGAETQVALVAGELRRRGHRVDVVSLLPPSAYAAELQAADVGLQAPGLARIAFTLAKLRPEILHCHMFHANLAGRLLGTVLPFPAIISTLHSTAESKAGTGGQLRARDFVYRLTNGLADAVVGVSTAVVDRHRSAHAIRTARVIPNGIDTGRFHPASRDQRARMRAALGLTNEFTWIAVGRLMWKKNFQALLRAFPADSGTALLLVGAGPDEPELRASAGPNIRFLGERTDIPDLLGAADAYVISSTVEGLPLALLEAAACGLPCLATDVGGIRETGIGFVLQNSSELADGLRHVQSLTPEQRTALGQAGRTIVESRFSLSAVATEWENLYRELLTAST